MFELIIHVLYLHTTLRLPLSFRGDAVLSVDEPISCMGDIDIMEKPYGVATPAPSQGGCNRKTLLAGTSLVVLACVVSAIVAVSVSNNDSSGTAPTHLLTAGLVQDTSSFSSTSLTAFDSCWNSQIFGGCSTSAWGTARQGVTPPAVGTLMAVPGVGSAEEFMDNECQIDATGGLKCGISNPLAAPTGAAQLLFYRQVNPNPKRTVAHC
jgi:hypothetical protein